MKCCHDLFDYEDFCRAVRIFLFLLLIWEKHSLFVVELTLFIEASTVKNKKKIANGLAKLNYNLKFLYLTFNKVALNVDIHRMRCFPTRGSINVLITAIVVAIISLHSVSPGIVSIVYRELSFIAPGQFRLTACGRNHRMVRPDD